MRRKIVPVLLGAVAFGLGGCASAAELRARDIATCQSYGFQEGTNEFAGCVQREQLAREYYWAAPYSYGPLFPYSGF